jgi:hypothetical protein
LNFFPRAFSSALAILPSISSNTQNQYDERSHSKSAKGADARRQAETNDLQTLGGELDTASVLRVLQC